VEAPYGFFEGRRPLNLRRLPGGGRQKGFAEYLNISAPIATLLSKRMATLHELDTVYGVRDVYDMLEVVTVDDYNNALSRQE
jgi:hypothetical protein